MHPFLIDTHAHIYLPDFDSDRQAIVERATAAGVEAIFLPAIDSSTHAAMLQTEAQFPICKSMIGLHPCSVKEDFKDELDFIQRHLEERRFIAIGEIGLDFYWDKTFTAQQYAAFHQQIALANQYQLPIVIHSRNATDECIAVVRQYPGLRGVFHCFSGNEEQARQVIALGFYLGIGGVITFKNGGMDKVVQTVGIEHVILETDAPYLSPVPFRGKRNEPGYTKFVAEKIANLLNREVDEIGGITSANAKKLFGIAENP
ncbi:MAG: TatD family hydrolase [Bacteroidota bacterium]|nr:TatD family hydrolase [Bacteroidota bacterium]